VTRPPARLSASCGRRTARFDYTAADCRSRMADIGFRDTYAEPLPGPDSMVVGIK
jgi:hypothetical protein